MLNELNKLHALSDDELLEHRAGLFDRHEWCERSGDSHRSLVAEARYINAILRVREFGAHHGCNPRSFAEAFCALVRARRELDMRVDESIEAAAVEVASAQMRGQTNE